MIFRETSPCAPPRAQAWRTISTSVREDDEGACTVRILQRRLENRAIRRRGLAPRIGDPAPPGAPRLGPVAPSSAPGRPYSIPFSFS
jgi:hypothetical protein